MDRIPTKIKWKLYALLHCISSFEGVITSYKNLEITPLDLIFVVFISFYISRYHFLPIFRTSFNIIWKKNFCHKLSIFNGFTQPIPAPPLNSQNPLSMRKVFVDANCIIQIAFFWEVSHWCTDCAGLLSSLIKVCV